MSWRRSAKPADWSPRRGDVCLFALDKERPAIVISNNALNRYSLDLCIVPISKVEHRRFSLRPKLPAGIGGLAYDSWVKCDQVTTLEKSSAVFPPLGTLDSESLKQVEAAIRVALVLP